MGFGEGELKIIYLDYEGFGHLSAPPKFSLLILVLACWIVKCWIVLAKRLLFHLIITKLGVIEPSEGKRESLFQL